MRGARSVVHGLLCGFALSLLPTCVESDRWCPSVRSGQYVVSDVQPEDSAEDYDHLLGADVVIDRRELTLVFTRPDGARERVRWALR